MVLRDSTGGIVFSACRYLLHCASPLQAELAACLKGLNFAMQWSTLPIDVEMDCQVDVDSIQAQSMDRSEHVMLVNEVRKLLGERDNSIAHISRNQNVVSHRLASFGHVEARMAIYIKSASSCAASSAPLSQRSFLFFPGALARGRAAALPRHCRPQEPSPAPRRLRLQRGIASPPPAAIFFDIGSRGASEYIWFPFSSVLNRFKFHSLQLSDRYMDMMIIIRLAGVTSSLELRIPNSYLESIIGSDGANLAEIRQPDLWCKNEATCSPFWLSAGIHHMEIQRYCRTN
ncbi:uncharacterized protein LOC119310078 [Triticum dicoccoides]|uniref:uncharacterized protein LOC119310078 n=1 Tax=Triticum dicoccoides TaxID=85692 RepID=UPI001890E13F|nr:uncharacterized protein LOC119310078 [Triticum dicoccoides]